MVEFLLVGESRTSKIRRDLANMRRIFTEGRADLRTAGKWTGGPAGRLLALIGWHQAHNGDCATCADHPERSFSHRVAAVTGRYGAAAGAAATVGLMVVRTARRTPGS